jgi:hypothetical protein
MPTGLPTTLLIRRIDGASIGFPASAGLWVLLLIPIVAMLVVALVLSHEGGQAANEYILDFAEYAKTAM